MKFDHRLIVLDDHVLGMKLRALRKNLSRLGESTFYERLLREVVTGKRVRPLHSPIHVVGYMVEKGSAVAPLKSLENIANTIGCNSQFDFSFLAVSLLRSVS